MIVHAWGGASVLSFAVFAGLYLSRKESDVKACLLHAIGELRIEDVPTPDIGPDEVLVKVKACGVCGSDIPRVFTKGTYRFPTIPGHEFAGEVAAVGTNAPDDWVGQRVAVFPLIPCQTCAACRTGAFAQCEDYDYLGSRSDGAFAEYAHVPVWNLIPAPDAVSYEEAAMLEPAAVALHAMRRGRLDAGDSILIFGAGPIGLMLGGWARTCGARSVLLVDIDDRKVAFAQEIGFKHVFNPAQQDDLGGWVRGITGHGADVVVEASGSSAALEQCMPNARTFGTVVLMGNPAGPMTLSQQSYWAILRNELRVVGTWNSVYAGMPKDEWRLALEFMASGQLDVAPLISHRVALEDLSDALTMMRDGTEFFSKVMYVAPE